MRRHRAYRTNTNEDSHGRFFAGRYLNIRRHTPVSTLVQGAPAYSLVVHRTDMRGVETLCDGSTEAKGREMKKLLVIVLLITLGLGFASAQDNGHPLIPSVVVVSTFMSMGTGFVVSYDGYIITCAHVVEMAIPGMSFAWFAEPAGVSKFRLVHVNEQYDWAVIKVDDRPGLTPVEFEFPSSAKVGDKIYTMGHPLGMGWMLGTGYLASVKYEPNGVRYLYGDIVNEHGSSGSPIFTEDYKVIGMVQQGITGVGAIGIGAVDMYNIILAVIENDRLLSATRKMLEEDGKALETEWKKLLDPDNEGRSIDIRPGQPLPELKDLP